LFALHTIEVGEIFERRTTGIVGVQNTPYIEVTPDAGIAIRLFVHARNVFPYVSNAKLLMRDPWNSESCIFSGTKPFFILHIVEERESNTNTLLL